MFCMFQFWPGLLGIFLFFSCCGGLVKGSGETSCCWLGVLAHFRAKVSRAGKNLKAELRVILTVWAEPRKKCVNRNILPKNCINGDILRKSA